MAVGGGYHASPVVIQAMDLTGTVGQHGVCIGAYRHRHSAGLTETLPQATPIRPSRVTEGASAPPQAPDGPCSLFGASLAPVCSPRLCLVAILGGGGSEAKKKFVYLKSTSKFGPL